MNKWCGVNNKIINKLELNIFKSKPFNTYNRLNPKTYVIIKIYKFTKVPKKRFIFLKPTKNMSIKVYQTEIF